MNPIIKRYPNHRALILASCEFISNLAQQCVRENGVFSIALSGGRTPTPLDKKLASPPTRETMPWPRMYFFWGDERCVAADHENSVFPSLDLILLGMGKDGHTASLFPEDQALSETNYALYLFSRTIQDILM